MTEEKLTGTNVPDSALLNGKVKTGVWGLDNILHGGLPEFRLYLVEGTPGTGKTTMALQFLLEGRRRGDRGLYVTLSETKEELLDVARSHGWNLDGIDLYELEDMAARLRPTEEYTVFHPEEVELAETVKQVCAVVERIQPSRVVFDSLSEMRLLARDPLRYRRQILSLKQFFTGRRCTVLLLDDATAQSSDLQLQSISHGVLSLERIDQEYGAPRRRMGMVKLRGAYFREGFHDYRIMTGGVHVFPRLVAAEHRHKHVTDVFASGLEKLDAILGGGINRGTSTLIIGPAGSGKSSLAGLYLRAAAERGEHAAAYVFEESRQTVIERMAGIGMDLRKYLEKGMLHLQQIDPAELSPGELMQSIRDEVEQRQARVILIDSLNGYLNAIPNERFLLIQLHELLSYMAEKGVVSILVVAQAGVVGHMQSPVDVSYLADTLVLCRFFESHGAVKKAVSVVKNRKGAHEETIREFQISPEGISIGQVLRDFHGVLTGVPSYVGKSESLLNAKA